MSAAIPATSCEVRAANLKSAPVSGCPVNGERFDRRVHIVDDDASVRDSLSFLLETLGFEVLTHASAGELLADDRRRNAGCLIVDHHMPGMNGLDMLAALRGEGSVVPAILITGRLDGGMTARARPLDVSAILEKPFSITRLIELVRAGLDRER